MSWAAREKGFSSALSPFPPTGACAGLFEGPQRQAGLGAGSGCFPEASPKVVISPHTSQEAPGGTSQHTPWQLPGGQQEVGLFLTLPEPRLGHLGSQPVAPVPPCPAPQEAPDTQT